MIIFTSNYANCKLGNKVSISGDKGNSIGFYGNSYTKLAPKRDFWEEWHKNTNVLSALDNNIFYMEHFYNDVLSVLDPRDVIKDLSEFGNIITLLCYENMPEFCHRHLVAAWLEETLKICVSEVQIDSNNTYTIVRKDMPFLIYFKKILKR